MINNLLKLKKNYVYDPPSNSKKLIKLNIFFCIHLKLLDLSLFFVYNITL